jgi:tRNA pseudouridine55 synthase
MTDTPIPHGIIAINKPVGPTSHRMINLVRRASNEKRVGHAGTLDPLASGVLVVGIGREFTKQLDSFVLAEKVYEAEFTLGVTSTTDDEQGDKVFKTGCKQPTLEDVQKALQHFVGTIWQIPPQFSAIKINGQKAYDLARKGLVANMEPREREVKAIEVLEYAWPKLKLKITTGKGVYIRSLARDLGEALGTGAYMSALKRTRVGQFGLEDCVKLPGQ